MLAIIITRLKVFGYYLIGHRNDVTLRQITMRTFCPPTSIEAKKYYRVEPGGGGCNNEWLLLDLLREGEKIYWPKKYGLVTFNEFICEVYEDYKLHTYEKYGTMIEGDDILLDLGASEGFFSLYASKKSQKVYAVEPDPLFVEAMEKSFSGRDNIEIIQAGVSDHTGRYFMENGAVREITGEAEEDSNIYRLISVDSEFYHKQRKVTYIKADLEGFELEMLEGAKKTIAANSPKISITAYHKPDHAEKIGKMIKEINPNYRIVFSGLSKWGTPSMIHAWVDK